MHLPPAVSRKLHPKTRGLLKALEDILSQQKGDEAFDATFQSEKIRKEIAKLKKDKKGAIPRLQKIIDKEILSLTGKLKQTTPRRLSPAKEKLVFADDILGLCEKLQNQKLNITGGKTFEDFKATLVKDLDRCLVFEGRKSVVTEFEGFAKMLDEAEKKAYSSPPSKDPLLDGGEE